MNLRAVIFDVYGTLLEVAPPPSAGDLEQAWKNLHQEFFHAAPARTHAAFLAECQGLIRREHSVARGRGIPHPEILWPDIAHTALPELGTLTGHRQNDCLRRIAGLPRAIRLAPGAGAAVRALHQQGMLLGIASNAQAYTLPELDEAFSPQGLRLDLFPACLRFWSFEHGFSKPDPHVFRILSARLQSRGVAPGETLMVGDRLDNDIEPARNAGWRTWHLHREGDGDWTRLINTLLPNPQPVIP